MSSSNKSKNAVGPSVYNMNNEKRGIGLVININKYSPNPMKLKEREWSKIDVINLTNTLKYLEFELILKENLTKSQIEKLLKELASRNYENFDCFLCVVMSHGNQDKIVTYDSQFISFDELMAPIKSCPSLVNKPKLFFFQACRGENQMESESRISSATSSKSGQFIIQMTDPSSFPVQPSIQTIKVKTKLDEESDLLVFNSTLPKHYSYSIDTNEGTLFIKSLCDVLYEYAYKNLPNNWSLAQMITKINEQVSNKKLQISVSEFRMSKEITFLPKNVSS